MLKSAKGSIRLEKDSCSNAKAIKKEELLVKEELKEQDGRSDLSQESIRGEEIIVEQSKEDPCRNVNTTQKKVGIDKDEPQGLESSNNSGSEEVIEISHRWKGKYLINYVTHPCPYCDWGSKKVCRNRNQQRLHVLFKLFSEDIFTALLTMLECTGGPCSLCGDSLPKRIGGFNVKYDGRVWKRNYKMFTSHRDRPLLSHFVTKHDLTMTKGLVFSDNKLNQKNVDLLLEMLFPS